MWTGKTPPPNIFQAAIELFGSAKHEVLFEKGGIVEGKVIRVVSANQALVRLSGIELMASTDTKLLEGQKIVGRVSNVEPRVTISLLKGETASDLKSNALMRLLLPTKAPMGEALAKIVATVDAGGLPPKVQRVMEGLGRDLRQVMAADLENIKPDKIKQTIKQSGLFLEATLKEAAQGKMSRQDIRSAVQTDVKAMISKALASVEREIGAMLKQIDRQSESGVEKDIPAVKKQAEQTQQKAQQVYIPKRASLSDPVIVRSTTQEAKKTSTDPVMVELLKANAAAKQLRDAFNNIELNQLLNASTKDKDSGAAPPQALYQIPFFEGLNLQTARVYIRPGKDGESKANGKKEGESRLVFMLDMSRLGPVRVDVSVQKKTGAGTMSAVGKIYTLNDSVAKFITDNLPGLTKPLELLGYNARFSVSSASESFVTEELENFTPITSKGIVDLKA